MKKVLIFLPDGVGLRNFAFSDFYEIGKHLGYNLTYWNNTVFPLEEKFGYNEVKIKNAKPHPLTDIFKRAKKRIELIQNYKKFKDSAYLSYIFPESYTNFRKAIKSLLVKGIVTFNNSEKGLVRVRKAIHFLERRSTYYKSSIKYLDEFRPDMVFCTNQRPLLGVSPILAAQDLGIPTVTFIFSWDNLPKGMLVIETDFYFVWSEFMKKELSKYYSFINNNQVKVVGSPQFASHFNSSNFIDKSDFFRTFNLDLSKQYICFSGDDVTTSPYDQFYLEDLAHCVRDMNKEEGTNIGIIYRKCPVDFTNRHLNILNKFKNEITTIEPLWENLGNGWNHVMPTPDDTKLLVNTIKHSKLVINVGSSMVFDAIAHQVPCAYINYNTEKGDTSYWNINKIYKYIHFQSMPSKSAVFWAHRKEDFSLIIKSILTDTLDLSLTQQWFDKVCKSPQKNASKNIWKEIEQIL